MSERNLGPLGPDDLELDLSQAEVKKASKPLLPGGDGSPESTHPLTEAPLPSGAALNSGGLLEPVLSEVDDGQDFDVARIAAPSFFLRLGLEAGSGAPSRVAAVCDQAWSLSSGESWPVFVKRLKIPRPASTALLKRLALAARRFGDNRLCLTPYGNLDVFFNDRGSLEQFVEETNRDAEPAKPSPVKIMACRGLLLCPTAAVDSLSAAARLEEIFSGHSWPTMGGRRRQPLTFTVAGCSAGCGLDCGVHEYADLRLIGRRDGLPVIDQDLAGLSPRLSLLTSDCPGLAIKRSHRPGAALEIEPAKCRRCGWCVNEDPAFSWPTPQGGFFTLELSGRRKNPPYDYVSPRRLWPRVSDDWVEVGLGLMQIIERWMGEAEDDELLADFVERKGQAWSRRTLGLPETADETPLTFEAGGGLGAGEA
jgi:dissimilatory sulfite reductase (desulfoviridin) alpha/beta subunit